ncbi:MAG: polysaccharide deacetylase family protein [Coriobacteriales bacterium]|nr:polysaccharide deacetylase family protein [Coriobacteriales bacterium]
MREERPRRSVRGSSRTDPSRYAARRSSAAVRGVTRRGRANRAQPMDWLCGALAVIGCLLLAFVVVSGARKTFDLSAQGEGEREEQEDLAWRDKDFAVDPARTDWNYEGDGRKVVYLTIDDGPSENTQAVLDILDQYGCKATFFVVGASPDYYPMIGEAYRRGHTIGLHSYTHDYAQVYASEEAYYADLDAIGQVVSDQIGYVPCFIRFPGGASNEISADYCLGIMSALTNSVQERGYQYYDWNMSTGDGAEHTADEIVGFATADPGFDTIMLLCHDSATKGSTVEALPRIIEYYQALGYSFEAISRTSPVVQHGVNN